MEEKIICSRCGKEITEIEELIKLTESDTFNGRQESYWCKNCYNEFIKELEN